MIAISSEDRDLLDNRIMIHLSGIDSVWLAARHKDYAAVDRLGHEVCDELALVLDDLGWGETRGEEPVVLGTPSDAIRRVIGLFAERAMAEGVEESREQTALERQAGKNRELRSMCDELLAALDGEPAPAGSDV